MPLQAPKFTPPRRKGQSNQSKPQNAKSNKSHPGRNYDEELRRYLATTSQHIPDVSNASAGILNSSLKMPFSKDFGSFDLTICLTEDKKCVVLVKYERRIFINGVQIYISPDGRVCDSHGHPDVTLQNCYDCALKTRRTMRKSSSIRTAANDGEIELEIEKEELRSDTLDKCSDADVETLNESKYESAIDQWGLPEPPYKRRISVEDEMQALEANFNQIITAMCTLILEVSDHENTDTESAHSDGDSRCLDQRQLIQEAIRRFSYQFQSVVELSTNLHNQITAVNDEGGGYGDDESSDVSSVTSETFTGSASSTAFRNMTNTRELRRITSETPAWIHDSRSWKNEKARLNAELAAAGSEHRRLERRHEELQVQFEETQKAREELQELLSDYEGENNKLKRRCARMELSGIKHTGLEADDIQQKSVVREYAVDTFVDENLPDEIDRICEQRSTSVSDEKSTGMFSRKFKLGNKTGKFLKSEMKRLRHVADDMEDDMSKIMKENVSLRVRVNQMERDRKDLKERLRVSGSLCDETKADMACLDKKNAELETRCQKLERERANGEAEIGRTNNVLVELRSQYRTLERDCVELEKAVKMLATEKQRQREELDQLERSEIECKNSSALLAKDNSDLQASLSQSKRDKSSLEADIRLLREEHETTCAARNKAEDLQKAALSDLHELKRAHVELAEQIVRLQEAAAATERRCKSVQKQNEELVSRTQELENQNETLENRTRSLSNTGRLLEVENSELKHMLRRLRSDNVEMKTKMMTLAKANGDFRGKVEQWDRENASAEGKMRSLVRAKTDLQTIIRQMASDANSHFEKMDIECAQLQEQQQRSKTQLVNDVDVVGALSAVALDIQSWEDSAGNFNMKSSIPH